MASKTSHKYAQQPPSVTLLQTKGPAPSASRPIIRPVLCAHMQPKPHSELLPGQSRVAGKHLDVWGCHMEKQF